MRPFPRVGLLGALILFGGALASARGHQKSFAALLVEGGRQEVARQPKYVSAYYPGGRPPPGEGVCTDLIWRAFEHAGVDLKMRVDADIAYNTVEYPRITVPDPNIDFRRVANLTVFFSRHAERLSTVFELETPPSLSNWLPGDIVVFQNPDHIALLSDRRSMTGAPLLIHNQGIGSSEGDDLLARYERGIVARFRYSGLAEANFRDGQERVLGDLPRTHTDTE